jgi:hypothetical protein
MVLQIKSFQGPPSIVENSINRLLREQGDNIEVIDFRVGYLKRRGSPPSENVVYLLYSIQE